MYNYNSIELTLDTLRFTLYITSNQPKSNQQGISNP